MKQLTGTVLILVLLALPYGMRAQGTDGNWSESTGFSQESLDRVERILEAFEAGEEFQGPADCNVCWTYYSPIQGFGHQFGSDPGIWLPWPWGQFGVEIFFEEAFAPEEDPLADVGHTYFLPGKCTDLHVWFEPEELPEAMAAAEGGDLDRLLHVLSENQSRITVSKVAPFLLWTCSGKTGASRISDQVWVALRTE